MRSTTQIKILLVANLLFVMHISGKVDQRGTTLIVNWIYVALAVWFLYGLVTPIIRNAATAFKRGGNEGFEAGLGQIFRMVALLFVAGICFLIAITPYTQK